MTQVQLLTIVDESLSLPDLLINEYLLIAKAKITLLRSDFLLRLLEEDFLNQELELLHFPNMLVQCTEIVLESNILVLQLLEYVGHFLIYFVDLLEVGWGEFVVRDPLILVYAHIAHAEYDSLRVIDKEHNFDADIDHEL